MKLVQVLREQGRIRSWFARQMGMERSLLVYRLKAGPRVWTREMRSRAADVLGVPVEELFPLNEEGEIIWLDYGLRLVGKNRRALARRLGVSEASVSRMISGERSWSGREQEVGEILGIDPARLMEKVAETGRGGDGR